MSWQNVIIFLGGAMLLAVGLFILYWLYKQTIQSLLIIPHLSARLDAIETANASLRGFVNNMATREKKRTKAEPEVEEDANLSSLSPEEKQFLESTIEYREMQKQKGLIR